MTPDTTTRPRPATAKRPCPVCDGDHKCSVKPDGLIFCGRREGVQPGFVSLGRTKDGTWGMYRLEGYSVLEARRDDRKRNNGNGHPKQSPSPPPAPSRDWCRECDRFAANLTPELRQELADALGLPVTSLIHLAGIGWREGNPNADDERERLPRWTFPERDSTGRVIGINQRWRDGKKKVMFGSSRGLYVPEHWNRGTGPVFLVEGASDALTLAAMGLAVVGRPNNVAGVDHLAELLRDLPADRPLVVIGETDPKPDGKWPGKKGAIKTAAKLAEALGGTGDAR